MSAPPTNVSVRMYRALDPAQPYKGLLGDCFLLRLAAGDQKAHILIDFGLLLGSPDADKRAMRIAENIVEECGGDLAKGIPGKLDLLVVTHEHWDHISGFSQAGQIFFDDKKLIVENLWMAWTEDEDDEDAKELGAKRKASANAFAALAQRLGEQKIVGLDAGRAMHGLDGFLGLVDKKSKKLTGEQIFASLKKANKKKEAGTKPYRRPGEVLMTPGAVTLRTYVLGPPRDRKRLFKDTPSSGAAQETYLETPTLGDALLKVAEGGDPLDLAGSSFAPQYCRQSLQAVPQAAKDGDTGAIWLDEKYFQASATGTTKEIADRRRIDGEWLAAAGALALKLDSDTNNTSLVLAFDLPDGSSMLFAADAQVGNWLSWHDQGYTDETDNTHSATDILNRTRFYKVGHHGSHNATLDTLGLALMTRDDLVAAIPTDEELGKKQGRGGWQMPNPRVRAALIERTKGRILRNDRHYFPKEPKKRKDDAELAGVDPKFFTHITEEDLFLEYQLI